MFKSKLKFDFYLSEYNTCIEYNGVQHYEPVEYFGGMCKFILQQKRDLIKENYCIQNNIKIYVIKYDENITEKLEHILNF